MQKSIGRAVQKQTKYKMCANYIDIGNNVFVKPVLDSNTWIDSVEIRVRRTLKRIPQIRDYKTVNDVTITYNIQNVKPVIPLQLNFYNPQCGIKKVAHVRQWSGEEIRLRLDNQEQCCLTTVDEMSDLCLNVRQCDVKYANNKKHDLEITTIMLVEYVRTECDRTEPPDGMDKCCNTPLVTYVACGKSTVQTFNAVPYLKRNLRTICVTNIKFEIVNVPLT